MYSSSVGLFVARFRTTVISLPLDEYLFGSTYLEEKKKKERKEKRREEKGGKKENRVCFYSAVVTAEVTYNS